MFFRYAMWKHAYMREWACITTAVAFREQCEELRGTLSKRQQDQVAAERMEQLLLKEEAAKKLEEEERMYADLW